MYITQTLVDLWGRLETHLKKTNEASKIKSATFSVFSPVWTTVLLKEEMEDAALFRLSHRSVYEKIPEVFS